MHADALPARRGLFRSLAILAGGTAFAQVLGVACYPLITRLYGPPELGAFSVFLSTVLILNTIDSLRYEMAIPVAESEEDVSHLLLLIGLLILIYCALVGGALGLWGRAFCERLKVPGLYPYVWLVPLCIAAAGAYEALNFLTIRARNFSHLAKARASQSSGQVVTQIGMGAMHAGTFGLVLGDTVGRTLSAIALGWQAGLGARWREATLSGAWRVAKAYARFPKFLAFATLLNIATLQVPLLMIPGYFGSTQAGYYFVAYSTLALPAKFIGAALAQVFLGEASQMVKEPERLKAFATRVFLLLVSAYLPIYLVACIGGRSLFPVIFGAKWLVAGQYAVILAPMTFLWATASPISSLLVVKDRLHESLVFTGLELVSMVAAITLGGRSGSLRTTALLISTLGVLTSLASVWRFLRAAHVSFAEVFRTLAWLLLLHAPLGLVTWLLCRWLQPMMALGAVLLAVAMTGVGTYRLLKSRSLL